jgi:hypothetical protein
VYYGTPPAIFFVRILLYLAIGLLEGYLLMLLFRSKTFVGELKNIMTNQKRTKK